MYMSLDSGHCPLLSGLYARVFVAKCLMPPIVSFCCVSSLLEMRLQRDLFVKVFTIPFVSFVAKSRQELS